MSNPSFLGKKTTVFSGNNDEIVVMRDLCDVAGGATLDVSSVAAGTQYIAAGHIIKKTAAGDYAPLGVSSNNYVSLASGESYAGVLKKTIAVEDPRAAILTAGQVNAAASPYPVTDTIKSGLARIEFCY